MSLMLKGDLETMYVSDLDQDKEVEFAITITESPDTHYAWLDKQDAIELIEHLKQQFGIGGR